MDEDSILILDNFIKQKKIAHGTYGDVFKGIKQDTGEVFAIKISKQTVNDREKTLKRNIRREVTNLTNLNHPAIIKFIGYSPTNFENRHKPVIITEYVSNGTLSNLIKLDMMLKAPTSWDSTKKLINIYGIASAISYLHSKKIIHRDIKPANILEDDYLFPKVADFGLSKTIHLNEESFSLESSTGAKGSPLYMAPEIWEENIYTEATDVYAFGMLVYLIMIPSEPFKNLTSVQIGHKVTKGDRPPFDKPIKKCYKELITQCWEQDPSKRPTFSVIIEKLKENKEFISDDVDLKKFQNYINFLDNPDECENEVNNSFEKVVLSSFISNKHQKRKVSLRIDPNDRLSVLLNDLMKNEGFVKLSKEVQDFFVDALKSQKQNNNKSIIIPNDKVVTFFDNNLFNSLDFLRVLNFFSSVSIEIRYPSQFFFHIFYVLMKIIQENLSKSHFNLIVSDLANIKEYLKVANNQVSVTIEPSINVIKSKAFAGCTSIAHLSLPSSVTKLEESVFDGCNSLTEIEIPSSVTEIGPLLFKGCISLERVDIKSPITVIKRFTFLKCSSLTKITIPSSVKKIENGAFAGCCSLEEITLPCLVDDIGVSAFSGCFSLKRFTIPSNVTKIKEGTFNECSSLREIIIPPSVSDIESGAFSACESLVSIDLPSSVTSIGNSVFSFCRSLTELTIPLFVMRIGEYTFNGCVQLEKVEIPSLITTIGEGTFIGCTSLEEVTIPSSITSIGKRAFERCFALEKVVFQTSSLTAISYSAFNLCTSLKTIEIPSSVTSIDDYAFNKCKDLAEVSIPCSVTKIGKYAFRGCTSLKNVSLSSDLELIEESSFEGCSSLESITVPSSVVEIEKCAFEGCSSLNDVTFNSSLVVIGESAFHGCSSMKRIEIPSSVKTINKNAFMGCSSMKQITIPMSIRKLFLASHLGLDEKTKVKRF